MLIRWAKMEEQEEIEAMSQLDRHVKDFKYLWRLYKNWAPGKSMPMVATDEEKIIGFNAANFGKKYVNSYYRFILPEYRRLKLGKTFLDFSLQEAHKRQIPRYKFTIPTDVPTLAFWDALGIKPYGQRGNELLFDIDISDVKDIGDLHPSDIPVEVLQKSEEKDVIILVPGYEKKMMDFADYLGH